MSKRLFEFMQEEQADSRIGEPLKLNIYDLTCVNGCLYWAGLGAYHSAIEAYGTEYAYGAHDYPNSGVFEVEPKQCPGFRFRKTIIVGTIWIDEETFRKFMEAMACEYTGESYNLMYKNCNHFCNDVCLHLIGSTIPNWVNRLAKLGLMCSCIIPKSIQSSGWHHDYSTDSDSNDEGFRRKIGSRSSRGLAGSLMMVMLKRGTLIRSSLSDAAVLFSQTQCDEFKDS